MTSNSEHSIQLTFDELIENSYKSIELFLFQYGFNPTQMDFIMEGVMSSVLEKLKNNPDAFTSENLQLAEVFTFLSVSTKEVELIEESDELEDLQGKIIFHFEDDEDLHRTIVNLKDELKVPLILHHFHNKGEEEIATIMDVSTDEIIDRLKQAESQLIENLFIETESQLLKLLGLLKKSYGRVGNLTDIEKVLATFRVKDAVSDKSHDTKKTSDKFSIWKPVLLISVIMVFFGSIIFVSESYGKVDDRFLAKLEKDFEKAKVEKSEKLQIDKGLFSQLYFVTQADLEFSRALFRLRRKIEKGEELQREEIKKEFEEIVDTIALPSEMVEELIRNPLIDDETKSNDFLRRYMERLEEIKYAYHQTLYDPTFQTNGQRKPVEVPEKMRKAMEKQNITYIDGQNYFPAIYLANEMTEKMKESIHPLSYPYLLIIEKSHFHDSLHDDFDQEEVLLTLRQFEEAYMDTKEFSDQYHYLSSVYSGIVMWFIDDSWRNADDKIFNYKGVVKENYRQIWKAFAEEGKDSPLSVLFQPMVDEMEENEWRFSQIQRYFDYSYLHEALNLAYQGRLDEFSYDRASVQQQIALEHLQREEFLGENHSYLSVIETLYNDFKHNSDPRYMGGNDPLTILGLYELARAEENVSGVYNLTYNTMPFNDFAEQWKPGKSLFEGVDSIKVDTSLVENNSENRREIPIIFMVDGKEEIRAKMVFINHYWLVSEVLY